MIKHIVLSGCGPNLITMLGTLQELHKQNFWNLNDVECFYGSSGGIIITIFMLLSDDFETLKEYLVKRPWHSVWTIEPQRLFGMYKRLGLFDIDDFYKGFEPFFLAKNIDKNITLAEFYQLTKKTINIYLAELNDFKVFFVNHETHPDMKLIEAVYMTSTVPCVFVPIIKDDKCFIDGALMNYFPTCDVLKKADKDSILGLCNERNSRRSVYNVSTDSNMFEFIISIVLKNVDYVIDDIFCKEELKNMIYIPGYNNKLWLDIINSQDKRTEMFELGYETARKFLSREEKEEEEGETSLLM